MQFGIYEKDNEYMLLCNASEENLRRPDPEYGRLVICLDEAEARKTRDDLAAKIEERRCKK